MTNSAKAPEMAAEQNKALELMLSGKNVFLTGEAGTGKSALLKKLCEKSNDKNTVFLAPTGITACNIKGRTIHSFCKLGLGLQTEDTIEAITNPRLQALLEAVDTIVIDEISMVRSDILWAVDNRLRAVASGRKQNRPFGGKQIIVCGDFFQLPPVVTTDVEKDYLKETFGGNFAFQTEIWEKAKFKVAMLKEQHRQSRDRVFYQILKNIRHGQLNEKNIVLSGKKEPVDAIDALNTCCYSKDNASKAPQAIALCTTRKQADAINGRQSSKLNTDAELFKAKITGSFPESEYPTEANLNLQKGARVMTLANKLLPDGSYEYVNGDMGCIEEISHTEDGLGYVSVRFDDGRSALIGAYEWPSYEYKLVYDRMSGKMKVERTVSGIFLQIPLRLAWAVTVHKSQGQTFDRAKLFLGNGCFASGQLYTALSRCRSLEGLVLDRKIVKEDIIIDPDVVNFYESLESPAIAG
ncbi:MAG: AAA family ATPase [Lentisphaeria bacterium]|nr:AAA family ATPase [Lentisphaeria bacterium]